MYLCKECPLIYTHKHELFAHILTKRECALNPDNIHRLHNNSQTSLLLEIRDRYPGANNKILDLVYHTNKRYSEGYSHLRCDYGCIRH